MRGVVWGPRLLHEGYITFMITKSEGKVIITLPSDLGLGDHKCYSTPLLVIAPHLRNITLIIISVIFPEWGAITNCDSIKWCYRFYIKHQRDYNYSAYYHIYKLYY